MRFFHSVIIISCEIFFEYIFSGLLVIASNFPELKRVIDEYQLGKVVDIDITSIKKMMKVIESQNMPLRFDVSQLDELSWDTKIKNLCLIYNELIYPHTTVAEKK